MSLLKDFKTKIKSNVVFKKINKNSNWFSLVKSVFKTRLEAIYGNQDSAIEKIKQGLDRTCEVMFYQSKPIGVLVYKNKLQNEYGFINALELKSLFLIEPELESGKGYGSLLFRRIEEVAREMGTKLIYFTASEKSDKSMQCAFKNGFKLIKNLQSGYGGSEEYLLINRLN